MTETTKTQSRVLDGGRKVRVVVGWNYTLYHYWFVVYVQEPGQKELRIPAPNSLAEEEQLAFDKGFAAGAALRAW